MILDEEALNTAPGIAEMLAGGGAEVLIVTRWLRPFEHLINTSEAVFIIPRLKRLGVTMQTQTYIKSIGDRNVTLFDIFTGEESEVSGVDAVVLVTMRNPHNALVKELEGRVPQLFAIGDALAPRGLAEATHEGQRFARMVGEEGAPMNFTEAYWAPQSEDAFVKPATAIGATARS